MKSLPEIKFSISSWLLLVLLLVQVIFQVSCLEYHPGIEGFNLPPFIDKTHVKPAPAELLIRPIRIGNNCRKEFSVPPIKDPNKHDQLYYLWFIKKPGELYGKLLQPRTGVIQTENRDNAVISLSLDKQTIETALKHNIDENFYSHAYLIEFYIADRQYLIPDNRYTGSHANEDFVYWMVSFSSQDC